MNRRTFIGTTVSTALLGLAGCSSDSEPTTETTTPEQNRTASTDGKYADAAREVLEKNWEAYWNADVEAYKATYHSESPRQETEPWNDEDYWPAPNSDFVVENRGVVREAETEVIFQEMLRATIDGETTTWESTVELRTENGEWKMWDYTES